METRRVPLPSLPRGAPEAEPPRRTSVLVGGAVVLAGVAGFAFWNWRRPAPPREPAAAASASAAVLAAPRCARVGEELVVGDAATAEIVAPDAGDGEDPLGAFA